MDFSSSPCKTWLLSNGGDGGSRKIVRVSFFFEVLPHGILLLFLLLLFVLQGKGNKKTHHNIISLVHAQSSKASEVQEYITPWDQTSLILVL